MYCPIRVKFVWSIICFICKLFLIMKIAFAETLLLCNYTCPFKLICAYFPYSYNAFINKKSCLKFTKFHYSRIVVTCIASLQLGYA